MSYGWSRRRFLVGLAAGSATLSGCAQAPGGGESLAFDVRETALRDQAIDVAVSAVSPGAEVTVRATTRDENGVEWASEAVFEADDDGSTDLSLHAPVEGTYRGVDPMGWLWSMAPVSDADRFAMGSDRDAYEVTLTARAEGTEVSRTTTRRLAAPDVTETRVESAIDGYLSVPPGEGPHPGVLVLHGSGGRPLRTDARLLASHGYAALALQWFGGERTPTQTYSEVPLSYFERAASWLRDRPDVTDGPLGVLGASKGAEAALLLGARFDWPGAVVTVAPPTIVMPGETLRTSTWAVDGDPVPFVSPPQNAERIDIGTTDEIRLRPLYEAIVERASPEELAAATIPVEETDAPLLLVSGGADQLLQSTPLANRAVRRLDSAGVDFPYRHLAFEDAGHSIRPPYKPTTRTLATRNFVLGGTPVANARAGAAAWPVVLSYLERGLG